MGGNSSKTKKKQNDLKKLVEETHFTFEEVQALNEKFMKISSSREDDGVIDLDEFRETLGLQDSIFVERLFTLFDDDKNGTIDFREFTAGLSVFCQKATLDEKLKLSFSIYDVDSDGHVTREELFQLLSASLMQAEVDLPEDAVRELVNATFEEADVDKDNKISFDEYKAMVMKHPEMLSAVTISTPID